MSETLADALLRRGYTIDETAVNARGRVVLVISGPGLAGVTMYQTDAQQLASGDLTPDELKERRERLSRMREG